MADQLGVSISDARAMADQCIVAAPVLDAELEQTHEQHQVAQTAGAGPGRLRRRQHLDRSRWWPSWRNATLAVLDLAREEADANVGGTKESYHFVVCNLGTQGIVLLCRI